MAGDFNGDGRTDLAVANSDANDVSVLLGNGDGTFQNQKTYPVGIEPDAIVAGDFTGDGRTDLAVANCDDQRRVGAAGQRRRHLPGPGDVRGGVAAQAPSWRGTSTATAGPTWPSPTHGDNDVSVLLGNGDGTFQNQMTYAVGTGPDAIVAGDFTGDGRTDLAVANYGSNDVSVLLGNGDGTFQNQVTYAVGTGPTPSWRATSTATAGPTWPSPTTAPTTCRCCWATATAPSRTR